MLQLFLAAAPKKEFTWETGLTVLGALVVLGYFIFTKPKPNPPEGDG